MNVKKLIGTIAGLAVLAGLSWHQVRHDSPGAGMEELMTGTALDAPSAQTPAPEISPSAEIASEQECEPSEDPGEELNCENSNGDSG